MNENHQSSRFGDIIDPAYKLATAPPFLHYSRLERICRAFFDFCQWFLVVVAISYVGAVSHSRALRYISIGSSSLLYIYAMYGSLALVDHLARKRLEPRMGENAYRITRVFLSSFAFVAFGYIVIPHLVAITLAFVKAQYLSSCSI